MRYTLENNKLKVEIDSFGAEIKSIFGKAANQEYIWNGDKKFWGRTSPVLFPFVGSLKDKQYTYKGKTFDMGQHGFARDMEHVMISMTKDEIWFELNATEETLKKYPFKFILNIGYKLVADGIKVMWKVSNPSDETMFFSIGAHPAFMCEANPVNDTSFAKQGYKLYFKTDKEELYYNLLDMSTGLVEDDAYSLKLDNGYCEITKDMFDRDALIFEDASIKEVSLVDASGKHYVTVRFDMPLFGIWSPAGKSAPFVCIEPWCGRCDRSTFIGTLEEREHQIKLAGGDTFETGYEINLGDVFFATMSESLV